MSKELTFRHNGKRITAHQDEKPTLGGIKPKTIIRFENEDGEYRQAPMRAEEFDKLELPRDFKKLQKLHDEAKEIPEESRMLDGRETDVFDGE